MLSGYLGRPEVWGFVLEALAAVREHRPDAWYVCDPVLGDEGELYMPAELVRTFREQAVPRADLLVPNRFELEWLVDRPVASVDEAVAAARELHDAGAREVVVKGLVLEHDGGRRSTSSASTTTPPGSRAPRTSRASGRARATSSRAC